jgi:hypothetical protein
MIILSRVDSTEIKIEVEESKQYGIMLSGGLDSAVLLYFILLDAKQKNLTLDITPFTIIKYDESYKFVNLIIDYLNNLVGCSIPYTTLIGNPDTRHDLHSINARKEIKNIKPKLDHLFSALNQNPPFTLKCVKELGWTPPNRLTSNLSIFEITPFLDLYKTHIVDLADQYGLHHLFELTHSCTEKTNERCNVCFQCEERAWAFKELNLTDTGKI